MCPGNPDRNFVEMLVTKKGKIMSRNGKDVVASIDSRAPVHLMVILIHGQSEDLLVKL